MTDTYLSAIVWTDPGKVSSATVHLDELETPRFPLEIFVHEEPPELSPFVLDVDHSIHASAREVVAKDGVDGGLSIVEDVTTQEWCEVWIVQVPLSDVPEWTGKVCPPSLRPGVIEVELDDGRVVLAR